jgi:transposase InsO family protein
VGRGRRHSLEERRRAIRLIDEAVADGARFRPACETAGLSARAVQRWKAEGIPEDRRAGPKTRPSNKLSEEERRHVLDLVNTPQYRDLPPAQIVPLLADQGEYVASESTIYRLLREADQAPHRSSARPRTSSAPRECVATGPNQVWSWDITYLRSSVAGQYFYLYLILDVWSRKIGRFRNPCGSLTA